MLLDGFKSRVDANKINNLPLGSGSRRAVRKLFVSSLGPSPLLIWETCEARNRLIENVDSGQAHAHQ